MYAPELGEVSRDIIVLERVFGVGVCRLERIVAAPLAMGTNLNVRSQISELKRKDHALVVETIDINGFGVGAT